MSFLLFCSLPVRLYALAVEFARALVLGAVQGVTEFLPVSSSGHLVVVRQLFGWPDEGLAFDAALHLGTLVALLVAFRRTWGEILRGRAPNLIRALIIGTIPAAGAGIFGRTLVETQFRGVRTIGVLFLVTAALLFLADRVAARRPLTAALSPRRSFLVGLAQAFALLPGLSRSGVTFAAGMLLGLPRERAVEFSFLLALPITAAAGLEGLREFVTLAPGSFFPALVGMLAAFAVGWAAIAFLLRTIRARTFTPYVLYLLVVGAFLLF